MTAKRIALAWELGSGWGHIMPLVALRHVLQQRGARCVLATPFNHQLTTLPLTTDNAWTAPDPLQHARSEIWPPATHAEMLLQSGFHDASHVAARTADWLAFLRRHDINCLVADHAPTALMAAGLHGTPAITLGNSFYVPPAITPGPAFRTWEAIDHDRLAQSEKQVLSILNQVRAQHDAPAWQATHSLYDVQRHFFRSFPELDHYDPATRGPQVSYLGSYTETSTGRPHYWPGRHGQTRLFAYLDASYPDLAGVLANLANSNLSVIVSLKGDADVAQLKRQLSNGSLHITSAPGVRLKNILREAALVVCHGGEGLIGGCVRHGVPVIVLARFAEQLIRGYRLQALGCAQALRLQEADQFPAALSAMLADSSIRQRARHLAQDITRRFGKSADLGLVADFLLTGRWSAGDRS